MARSRTRKNARSVRFVKNPRPAGRGRKPAARAPVRTTRASRPAVQVRPPTAPSNQSMPGWGQLEKGNRQGGPRRGGWDVLLDSVSTVRLSLYILSAAVLVTLYVGHVHATQSLAEEARGLRDDNHALHLRYNRIKGAFDQASGPTVIYERARRLGLTESLPNGYPVIID